MDFDLLLQLTRIKGPSGDEKAIRDFLLDHINKESGKWAVKPEVLSGPELQNNIVLVFGQARTAIFAHMDTIGFTTRYEDQLVPIGSPEIEDGYRLRGKDSLGEIECKLRVDEEGRIFHDFGRAIERGTNLVWNEPLKDLGHSVRGPYMDNRLGVYACLKVAESLTDGIIVFSTWEEHFGGAVPYLVKHIHENYGIKQTLVCDITWVTDGIRHGDGVVISMRDRNIPRRDYLDRIVSIAEDSGISYQLEVESSGSSDGREIQQSPYPIDWLFIGAPESGVHSPHEQVNKADVASMIALYRYLMAML